MWEPNEPPAVPDEYDEPVEYGECDQSYEDACDEAGLGNE